MTNQKLQIGFPMQVQEQMEICNVMKNMFLLQVQKGPIVLIEVQVKILQAGLIVVAEEVQVAVQDLHQEVFQGHQAAQAGAPVWQAEVGVVPLLHQAHLHLKDNLKNLL